MMRFEKKQRLAALGIVAGIAIIVFLVLMLRPPADVLSQKEIDALRAQYPICGNSSEQVHMRPMELTETIALSETFVYAEVSGPAKEYTRPGSTGIDELDTKREEQGITNAFTFFEYPLTIIKDSEHVYKEGQTITISANTDLRSALPKLEPGMQVVVPVAGMDAEPDDRKFYTHYGLYYVTEDEYAISAFDESLARTGSLVNGMKVDDLLEKLKKQPD